MRVLKALVIFLVLVAGCSKETTPVAAPTSAEGKWTYSTPDGKISVDFELIKHTTGITAGILIIKNPATIVVAGTSGVAVAQMFDVNLPAIDSIRINANDIALVQPYSIAFSGCTVAADFKSIQVANAEYTYPWGTLLTLTGVTLVRKP